MRGPEHYLEAEKLAFAYKAAITEAEKMPAKTAEQAEERFLACSNARSLLDKAQVHALLALTAATVLPSPDPAGSPEFRFEELRIEQAAWTAAVTG